MKHKVTTLAFSTAIGLLSLMQTTAASTTTIGSAAAAAKSNYSLEEMLTYAIQDEYVAKAEYQLIIDTFGSQRPFTNIMKAEDNHTAQLEVLFDAYDIAVPVNTAADYVVVFGSIADAKAVGVTAEINNIAMYQSFLEQQLPSDVEVVFENLVKASENHLAAFSRTSKTGTANRQGNGKNKVRTPMSAQTTPLHTNAAVEKQNRRFGNNK